MATAGALASHLVRDNTEASDRPRVSAVDLVPNSKVEFVQVDNRNRPIRDGGGKTSQGRVKPSIRRPSAWKPISSLLLGLAKAGMVDALILNSVNKDGLDKKHPVPEKFIDSCRQAVGLHYGWTWDTCSSVSDGQPFNLYLLSNIAKQAGDCDWSYPLDLVEGVPLGVDSPPLPCDHVWPTKEEMAKSSEDQEPDPPCSHDNYTSAAEFASQIEATFEEEKEIGPTLGPMDLATAAVICGCEPEEICCGSLAAIDEGDKVRTVHDGTIINVNPWIQRNTLCKTTSPGLQDLLWARIRALQFLRSKKTRKNITVERPPATSGADKGPQTKVTFFKADVTKAHRRIKVQRKDWKYQAASISDQIWLNLVGTTGSHQLSFTGAD
jgi:hypothetical protein